MDQLVKVRLVGEKTRYLFAIPRNIVGHLGLLVNQITYALSTIVATAAHNLEELIIITANLIESLLKLDSHLILTALE